MGSFLKAGLAKTLCGFIGGAGIAVIQLTHIKDATSIVVGVVTVVCLIYTAFFKGRKREKRK